MNQCKTCVDRKYKDNLTSCAVAELFHSFHELFRHLPLFGKYVKTYECGNYMADKKLTGFPDTVPVMCKCSIIYEVGDEK